MKHVSIHTDGSCFPNPGPGSWAAVIETNGSIVELVGKRVDRTTSNRMEMTAAIEALRSLKESCSVAITTDSQYLKRGAQDFMFWWHRKGWKKGGALIKNADLWREIWDLSRVHNVNWAWVRGHGDCQKNNRCDELAGSARKTRNL